MNVISRRLASSKCFFLFFFFFFFPLSFFFCYDTNDYLQIDYSSACDRWLGRQAKCEQVSLFFSIIFPYLANIVIFLLILFVTTTATTIATCNSIVTAREASRHGCQHGGMRLDTPSHFKHSKDY